MSIEVIAYDPAAQGKSQKVAHFPDFVWRYHRESITQLRHGGATVKQILAYLNDRHDFRPT